MAIRGGGPTTFECERRAGQGVIRGRDKEAAARIVGDMGRRQPAGTRIRRRRFSGYRIMPVFQ